MGVNWVHEREVLFTGVGGQGVQIVAKALAMAAVAEGREALLLPQYSGGMRGSKTNAELTVGDAPLRALPIVVAAWSAFVMDQAFYETIRPKLASGAVVVANSSLFHIPVEVDDAQLIEIPASDIAVELGSPMSAGFVLAAAFAAVTGLVAVPSLADAMRELVPPYRTQHIAANEAAIEAGAAHAPALAAPAWPEVVTS
jgi:2-oxoglutarate ferredoxin oxidoreductase subunit gamma